MPSALHTLLSHKRHKVSAQNPVYNTLCTMISFPLISHLQLYQRTDWRWVGGGCGLAEWYVWP